LAAGFAHGVDRCGCDLVECCRGAGAEVENAAAVRMVEKVEIDGDHVLDGDEITALLTRCISVRALEQLDASLGAILLEEMEHDGRHPRLVLLPRPIDVEIAEAGNLRS